MGPLRTLRAVTLRYSRTGCSPWETVCEEHNSLHQRSRLHGFSTECNIKGSIKTSSPTGRTVPVSPNTKGLRCPGAQFPRSLPPLPGLPHPASGSRRGPGLLLLPRGDPSAGGVRGGIPSEHRGSPEGPPPDSLLGDPQGLLGRRGRRRGGERGRPPCPGPALPGGAAPTFGGKTGASGGAPLGGPSVRTGSWRAEPSAGRVSEQRGLVPGVFLKSPGGLLSTRVSC